MKNNNIFRIFLEKIEENQEEVDDSNYKNVLYCEKSDIIKTEFSQLDLQIRKFFIQEYCEPIFHQKEGY